MLFHEIVGHRLEVHLVCYAKNGLETVVINVTFMPYFKETDLSVKSFSQQKPSFNNRVAGPQSGLEWPRGFHEVKVPRFLDIGTGRW